MDSKSGEKAQFKWYSVLPVKGLNFYFSLLFVIKTNPFRAGEQQHKQQKMLILFMSTSVKWTVKNRLAWQNSIWLRNFRIPYFQFGSFSIYFSFSFYHLSSLSFFFIYNISSISQCFGFSPSFAKKKGNRCWMKSLGRLKIEFCFLIFLFHNQNINLFHFYTKWHLSFYQNGV